MPIFDEPSPEARNHAWNCGDLEIDLAARAVRRDDGEVHLTRIRVQAPQSLDTTHNALLQQVWGAAYTDARQTLRVHIANLRRKIEPADGQRLIHTDHRIGYRLADVHSEGAARGRPGEGVIDREPVAVACPRYTTRGRGLRDFSARDYASRDSITANRCDCQCSPTEGAT